MNLILCEYKIHYNATLAPDTDPKAVVQGLLAEDNSYSKLANDLSKYWGDLVGK